LTGQWPRPAATALERWRTRAPVSFGEKVRYKMARDRRPILVMLADKCAVRDFAAQTIGECALPRMLASGSVPAMLPWEALPREYVVKVNHGSGGVVVVAESADPTRRLDGRTRRDSWGRHWVHPDRLDLEVLTGLLHQWLGMRYRQGPLLRYEWAYRDIEPKVLVEEYCGDEHGLPTDLKVLCIGGEPRLFSMFRRSREFRLSESRRFLAEEGEQARAAAQVTEATWNWLGQASRALSRDTDLLRVDWLLSKRGPLLGELTSYPSSGVPTFEGHARLTSDQVDATLSSLWMPPRRYQ
jgi:hypothetical protein